MRIRFSITLDVDREPPAIPPQPSGTESATEIRYQPSYIGFSPEEPE